MSRQTLLSLAFLLLVLGAIVVALLRHSAGNVFDPAAHATFEACMDAIPPEWAPGSLDRERAEIGCREAEMERRR